MALPPAVIAVAADPAQRPVHQEGDQQQDHRERDREVEVALAGLEHGGGGEHARGAADVAAQHHGGAHLGDHARAAITAQHRQSRLDGSTQSICSREAPSPSI
jgi:hypothetical protein